MSAMAQARIRHMESAAEVCTVALQDLPNHPGLCLEIVKAAERERIERQLVANALEATKRAAKPWWKRLW